MRPTFKVEELYDAIFNLETSTSFAHDTGSEKYCLSLLKDTINKDFKEVREDMDDCWDEENYETFVLNLLNWAKKGVSSKKLAQVSIETPTTDNTSLKVPPIRRPKPTNSSKTKPSLLKHTATQSENNLPPNGMIDFFYQGIKEFPIELFIECNPADSIPQSALWDAISFWGKMNGQQEQKNDPDRGTKIYSHIIEFLSELEKYIGFLRNHSVDPEVFPDGFQLANCDCGEIDGEISCYQQRLKSLFQISVSQAEIKESNRLNEQQSTQKKAGKYEHL